VELGEASSITEPAIAARLDALRKVYGTAVSEVSFTISPQGAEGDCDRDALWREMNK
jgi:hypothetical protein